MGISAIAAPALALGFLKLFFHFYSAFRFAWLDYVVAAGLIFGGVSLFATARSKTILAVSMALVFFELLKAIEDYHDRFDVLITIGAIAYLSTYILRFIRSSARA